MRAGYLINSNKNPNLGRNDMQPAAFSMQHGRIRCKTAPPPVQSGGFDSPTRLLCKQKSYTKFSVQNLGSFIHKKIKFCASDRLRYRWDGSNRLRLSMTKIDCNSCECVWTRGIRSKIAGIPIKLSNLPILDCPAKTSSSTQSHHSTDVP